MTLVFIVGILALVALLAWSAMRALSSRLFINSPYQVRAALAALSELGQDIVLFAHDSGKGGILADLRGRKELYDLPDGRYTMVARRSADMVMDGVPYSDADITRRRADPGVYIVFVKSGDSIYIIEALCRSRYCDRYTGMYEADGSCGYMLAALYSAFAYDNYIYRTLE